MTDEWVAPVAVGGYWGGAAVGGIEHMTSCRCATLVDEDAQRGAPIGLLTPDSRLPTPGS